ncbi:nucleotide sugar dehydrogenase [Halonotius terrestris]|uniref:UDP-N-acetyl-D-mannosamine dehydrogenase n=1 Tax=Halonotius terrestris TaxID=2487750 RepID=A0A8J8TC38_9EURY|nr:nucleotide sugar dehydrogenase [Halonotius terrestris]TQQ79345.1 nucleotide sugar dehydrogenase [Halonotius terrestris]
MSQQLDHGAGLYGTELSEPAQREAFTNGDVPVAVYGLGKMGLPLAAVYADVSGNTIGVDIDEEVVETVNRGECHVKREPGLADLVSETVADGSLRATTDATAAAADAAVHVLMVPTLLTDEQEPDLSILTAAVESIGAGLSPGDLVIVESTVPPRTTVDHVVPRLAEVSGLDPDEFGVAACPERTVSGEALQDIRGTHPKVVGGVDSESGRVAALLYGELSDNEIIETSDATIAEAVKVFEGVYRDVNIALANQLATYAEAMDADVTEAIDVANTQPFCEIHDPGPGVGGHCIPVYPYFLTGAFDVDDDLLPTARAVNDGMADYTVSMLEAILAAHGVDRDDPTVLLLGLTYKANIEELRNAPSLPIASHLRETGVKVLGVDPMIDSDDWGDLDDIERVDLADATAQQADAVVVVTPHEEFAALDWDAFDAPILDGRGSIDADATDAPIYRIGGVWPNVPADHGSNHE